MPDEQKIYLTAREIGKRRNSGQMTVAEIRTKLAMHGFTLLGD